MKIHHRTFVLATIAVTTGFLLAGCSSAADKAEISGVEAMAQVDLAPAEVLLAVAHGSEKKAAQRGLTEVSIGLDQPDDSWKNNLTAYDAETQQCITGNTTKFTGVIVESGVSDCSEGWLKTILSDLTYGDPGQIAVTREQDIFTLTDSSQSYIANETIEVTDGLISALTIKFGDGSESVVTVEYTFTPQAQEILTVAKPREIMEGGNPILVE
jgi:outer membrane murein-binding lipoprotein Lpp